MFRRLGAAAFGWSLLAAAGAAQPVDAVSYQVEPVVGAAGLAGVDVSLSFRGDADGRTDVWLPQSWAGTQNLDRAIGEVRIEGARLNRRGARLRLRHARGGWIRLTYRIRQDFAGPPVAGRDRPYRPSTQADGFTLIGRTAFARVAGRADRPVRFAWGRGAHGWETASDLDRSLGHDLDFEQLADSVLVGGRDVRLIERETGEHRVRLAVRGAWAFSDAELADRYVQIIAASEQIWAEPAAGYFLALTPMLPGPTATPRAQTGLGLGDGLAVWLTPGQSLDDATHVLAHEQQHAWLPDRLGGLAEGPREVLDFWFSEGFTDFYALRTELRLGLITPEAMIAAFDAALERQARTPARLDNAAVARAFFSDPVAAGVPYHRGLLLALMLDDRLDGRTGGRTGLDAVMRAMQRGQGTAPERLLTVYAELGGEDLRPILFEHVDRGAPIRLVPELFGGCLAVVETGLRQRLVPGPALADDRRSACVARLAGHRGYKDILI